MLFEKFCEVMDKLQRGTFEEFEKARSEMSALCVAADKQLGSPTQDAADWRDSPVKTDDSQFDKDYPVKSVGSHANR